MKKVFLLLMIVAVFSVSANALPILSTGGQDSHYPQWIVDLGHWLFD